MASRPPDSPIPSEERVDTIVCENVWKVFAGRSTDLAAERAVLTKVIGEGLSRSEALERFGCVVGVGGVSFSVPNGQTFCIMGLSGSGKSTLVRHINRLIEPTAGTIHIGGEDIGTKTPRQLRELRARKIGMVFQDVALWPHRTVRDNVAYGLEILGVTREERYRIAAEMLSLVQLAQWAGRYPDELSGGMRQRVGLARALATDPEILLLDEPFSALDPLIRRQLQAEFLQIAKAVSKTTVFITHDLNEAILLGDRIAIMKEGMFVQVGTPEEIVSRPADEYVSEFVRGVSRLDIITARSIMQPIVDGCSKSPGDLDALPTASETATLAELIDKAVTTSRAIAICAPDGRRVGLITKDALLQAVGQSAGRAS